MSALNLQDIANSLSEASKKCEGTGVSFAGKSLKLNSEDDAKEVAEAVKNCKNMQYLDLEGNTLGPDAAKAISKALEVNGTHLKRALWKDMFTGRMKDEIPLALQYLGTGLCTAGTRLVELDLSDNAFGPIGVKGLAALLKSSSCYTLQELRLNNNGLGTTGGKMLAEALSDCYKSSLISEQKPLALKVFVAGRNRLENKGAKALAKVFKMMKSLEEVSMPQNGIYHSGVSALAIGLSTNQNLRILNLNDNTVRPKGATALANVLPNFSFLERLNLGDCLIKTRGAIVLAEALSIKGNHPCLTEVNLSFNEIHTAAISAIAEIVSDKNQMTSLLLDGNAFSPEGQKLLRDTLEKYNQIDCLGSLDEDEYDEDSKDESDDDDDEDDEEDDEEDESKESEYEHEEEVNDIDKDADDREEPKQVTKALTVEEFLKSPTGENLLLVRGNKLQEFVDYIKSLSKSDYTNDDRYMDKFLKVIMNVSSFCGSGYGDVRVEAEKLSEGLYCELFAYATKHNDLPNANNALLVNLGLLKGEDKKSGQINCNLEGCYKALEKISQKEYFPSQTRDALKLFIEVPVKSSRSRTIDPYQEAKASLKVVLEKLQNT